MLEDLLFVGNPLEEAKSADGVWRTEVAQRLKKLKKLDGRLLRIFICIYLILWYGVCSCGAAILDYSPQTLSMSAM